MEMLIAIIGSGALSAIVSAIVASRRFERPFEKISTLQSEVSRVSELQRTADPGLDDDSDVQNRSRAHVLSYIARAQINARIAEGIVPRRSLLNTSIILFGVMCLFAGASMVVGSAVSGNIGDFLLPGISIVIAGSLAVFLGGVSEKFEGKARISLIRALEGAEYRGSDHGPSQSGVWASGMKPKFSWLERQFIPADTRSVLSDALEGIGHVAVQGATADRGVVRADDSG